MNDGKKQSGHESLQVCMEVSTTGFVRVIRSLLGCGHKVKFRVKGKSMWPALKDGRDQVVLGLAKEIAKGDLVLAQVQPDQYVLHRVINKEGELLILMGDGNLKATERCMCADVVGKVVVLIRKGRLIRADGLPFQIYSSIWMWLNPFKRYLLKVYRLMKGKNG